MNGYPTSARQKLTFILGVALIVLGVVIPVAIHMAG